MSFTNDFEISAFFTEYSDARFTKGEKITINKRKCKDAKGVSIVRSVLFLFRIAKEFDIMGNSYL